MIYRMAYFCLSCILLLSSVPGLGQEEFDRTCRLETPRGKSFEELTRSNDRILQESLTGNTNLMQRSERYIPLVFHFVLEEGSDSFSYSRILDQIEILNECFSGQNKDKSKTPAIFRPYANDHFGPLFCLGSRMQNGALEQGITHRFIQQVFIGDQLNPEGKAIIKFDQLGGTDAWDSDLYVNIWIGELENVQARSTLPNSVPKAELGIIIDPDFFGSYDENAKQYPYHQGKTLVHELAHYFNLLHIWGLEPSCTADDEINDTPLQDVIYTGCPTGEKRSCGDPDMYMNFMNFTHDECLLFFTMGQADRMLNSIETFYPDLAQNTFCQQASQIENILDSVLINYNAGSRRISMELPYPSCETISLEIYQLDGKLIRREKLFCESREEIDLNVLPAGIYILFLHTDDNFILRKLFVY